MADGPVSSEASHQNTHLLKNSALGSNGAQEDRQSSKRAFISNKVKSGLKTEKRAAKRELAFSE